MKKEIVKPIEIAIMVTIYNITTCLIIKCLGIKEFLYVSKRILEVILYTEKDTIDMRIRETTIMLKKIIFIRL